MKKVLSLLLLVLACASVKAGELHVATADPIYVDAPAGWKIARNDSPTPTFPMDTYKITAPGDRNLACLVSVLGTNQQGFADAKLLQKIVRGDSRPYVASPRDLAKVEVKDLKINGGLGFYANFVDPDLVGKPVKKGEYKTATPVILSLDTKYLIKVSIFCDDINGADYKEMVKIVESIKIKKD
jgi:hypothetical protein